MMNSERANRQPFVDLGLIAANASARIKRNFWHLDEAVCDDMARIASLEYLLEQMRCGIVDSDPQLVEAYESDISIDAKPSACEPNKKIGNVERDGLCMDDDAAITQGAAHIQRVFPEVDEETAVKAARIHQVEMFRIEERVCGPI